MNTSRPTRRHAAVRCVVFSLLICPLAPAVAEPDGSTVDIPQAPANQLTADQIAAGWISLFDGETLFGWQNTGDANWRVEAGALRADQGGSCFLMTRTEFSEYDLRVDFRCPPETNSGVFLRTDLTPSDPSSDCLELNIAPPSNPFPTGKFVGRENEEVAPLPRTDHSEGADEHIDPWDGEWHTFYVVVRRDQTVVYIDGRRSGQVATGSDATPPTGRVALQFREGPIAFRNVQLKPTGMASLFNGKDLTGWNTDRAEQSRFEVTDDGELRVLDGRGQLESNDKYRNFVLQLECRVDGDGLNSGVFFRCIPRDFMMGYECQISNASDEGDPERPADCGTGGIFRRQDARRIVAKDRQWFALTLAVSGPHMAAWVDGVQVSDWIDERPTHKNPRKGQRLKGGTLAIQGHDPTTDIRFRKMKIVELAR